MMHQIYQNMSLLSLVITSASELDFSARTYVNPVPCTLILIPTSGLKENNSLQILIGGLAET